MKRYVFFLSIIFSSLSLLAQAGNSDHIVGVWRSSDNGLMIKIDKVGNHFQGRIVWLQDGSVTQPLLDVNNPDERLRKMPLKGNKIIKELSFNPSESKWIGGTFYNHREGKLYNCHVSILNSDKIKIKRFLNDHREGVEETWIRQ